MPDQDSPPAGDAGQYAEAEETKDVPQQGWPPPGKVLTPAAQRALAEAAERRRLAKQAEEEAARTAPKELNGRDGPDPVRYGDWEVKGIISDF